MQIRFGSARKRNIIARINENRRLAESIVQVLAFANGALFRKMKEEERNLLAKIVAALAANKDNDTIARELNCSLEQIVPLRTAMGSDFKNRKYSEKPVTFLW